MENASKALIIAGGILIGLLIVSALLMMLSNVSVFQQNSQDAKKTEQIAKFNNQFEPYNKENITLNEMKSLRNKIENLKKNSEYDIALDIKWMDNNTQSLFDDENFKGSDEDKKELKQQSKFKCTKIVYEEKSGRIKELHFIQTARYSDGGG